MMNKEIKIEAALEIEAGKTYAIEVSKPVTKDEADYLLKAFEKKTGAKAILLFGAKMARAYHGR